MAELEKCPWPEWKTVQMIGRGSYGTVYEIRRQLVDEETESAALKVITIPQNPDDIQEMYSEGYDDESITATFHSYLKSIVAEYALMQKMDGSANVVTCKDIRYIQHDDGIGWDIYIRMELLVPLMKALAAQVTEDTVIKIGKDICNALILCEKHGIVHRDIKPQNIFVSPNGDYKLGDFGIAKTVEKTMGGTKIGTYKYMAPEVYNNQPYGKAADVYSLGLVLYWLLNERRMPFLPLPPAAVKAGMDEEARQRRLSGETLPAPAHGSEELKRIVLKACAYDPKDRYASAAAMLSDLNQLAGGTTAPNVPASSNKPQREEPVIDAAQPQQDFVTRAEREMPENRRQPAVGRSYEAGASDKEMQAKILQRNAMDRPKESSAAAEGPSKKIKAKGIVGTVFSFFGLAFASVALPFWITAIGRQAAALKIIAIVFGIIALIVSIPSVVLTNGANNAGFSKTVVKMGCIISTLGLLLGGMAVFFGMLA